MTRHLLPVILLGVGALVGAAADDVPIYNQIASDKLEKILNDLKIEFKKVPSKKEGVEFYDLKAGDVTMRLHSYQGQDLWLERVFSEPLTLDDVNRWNLRAKYSRAVLLKSEQPQVSLEAQLDCIGGVTDPLVRAFIGRFQGDVVAFTKFASKK